MALALGGDEARRVGQGGLAALHFGQGFAHHLLGQASAFAALVGDVESLADLPVAAATVEDRIADLTVSDTLAEADVHIQRGSSLGMA